MKYLPSFGVTQGVVKHKIGKELDYGRENRSANITHADVLYTYVFFNTSLYVEGDKNSRDRTVMIYRYKCYTLLHAHSLARTYICAKIKK
jgi:hypothetical protein